MFPCEYTALVLGNNKPKIKQELKIMKRKKNLILVCLSALLFVFLVSNSVLNQSILALQENRDSNYNLNSYDRFNWKWSVTDVVSTESAGESGVPEAVVDSSGNIHVVWADFFNYLSSGADSDVFYKSWNVLTSSWTTTEVVSTESGFDSYDPSFAIDTSGNIFVSWHDLTNYLSSGADYDIFYKYRNATTSSWSTTEVVSTGLGGDSFTPSIAVDSVGNVHIVWRDATAYGGSLSDLDILCRRWNATSAWSTIEVVSTQSDGNSISPEIFIDNAGDAHVAWHDYTDYLGADTDEDIFYKRWDAISYTWTMTEVVSTESTLNSQYASLVVDSIGNVHIAWHDLTNYLSSGADNDIFYKYKDALSSFWTTTEVISTESIGASYYNSITDDLEGNIHIAWYDDTEYSASGADIDVFYKRKDAISSLWSTTDVVSTESTGLSKFPSIDVDTLGIIHVVWDDYTDYATSDTDRDIFYKRLSGPPTAPELAFVVPNPDEDGSVYLDWNDVYGADIYYIYRSTSYIWSVEGLTPIDSTSTSNYIETLPSPGFYYYVIVAENYVENSAHSNCQYIEYKVPVLREFAITMGILSGAAVILIAITNLRKKKQKSRI